MRNYSFGGAKRLLGRSLMRIAARLTGPAPAQRHADSDPFLSWARNRSNRLITATYPGEWKGRLPTAPTSSKVAVIAHITDRSMTRRMLDLRDSFPVECDLILTNATGSALDIDSRGVTDGGRLVVLDMPGVGDDVWPLIAAVNASLLNPYELILRVQAGSDEWRDVGHGLFDSEASISAVLDAFATRPELGILAPDGGSRSADGRIDRSDSVKHLLRRIQMERDSGDGDIEVVVGSTYWMRGFLAQGMRAFELVAADFDGEAGSRLAESFPSVLGVVTRAAGFETRSRTAVSVGEACGIGVKRYSAGTVVRPRARAIPFYLPQFHTFPENDEWWEKGFTEWANVAAATPLYPGHAQPLLPSELGFYDVTRTGVRDAQYELAASAGIEGFMYYYYWFASKTLLQRPIENHLAGDGDQPFCIMWANENWTRRWDGSAQNILIAQDYDRVPATRFIHDVLPLITDPRYIRVGNKPLVAIYRITQIPDYVEVLAYWREVALQAGLPGLHLVTVDVGASMQGVDGDPLDHGLDASLEFAPHNMVWQALPRERFDLDERFAGNLLSYPVMAQQAEASLTDPRPPGRYPGVMVTFDNTARRQWQPDMWYGSNPYTFRRWFAAAVTSLAGLDHDDRVVFVNAWNEWAESAVLEPSQRFGRSYLLAVRDALYTDSLEFTQPSSG